MKNVSELKQISDALEEREKELNERERLLNKAVNSFKEKTKNYKLGKPIYG